MPSDWIRLEVWFTKGAQLFVVERAVPPTRAVARAAMTELLEGPNPNESTADISTAIPGGAELLGLSIDDRIATVDLSRRFEPSTGTTGELLTVAQVVYTLTQFSTVEAVHFHLEGQPVRLFASHGLLLQEPQTRSDYRELVH